MLVKKNRCASFVPDVKTRVIPEQDRNCAGSGSR
jgi:hypothetical protein